MPMPIEFRRGVPQFTGGGGGKFAAAALPLADKLALCRQLLAEFGVTHVTERGNELIHSCCLPFGGHRNGDRNPSASLNYEKLTYNCFGCGNSGGLLWFIAVCRDEDTDASRRWLERELNLTDDEESIDRLLAWIDEMYSPKQRHSVVIPRMDARVLDQWAVIHPWMTEVRRIPVDTYIHFRVGYGTFRMNVGDDEQPNWISSERIVIPHFWKGDLVGWQTRRLIDDGTPKYKSSPDMPKDTTLFNYQRGRKALIVESPMSVLSKWHRCPEIQATFGAEVTEHQIRLIADSREVTLWMDNDNAGWKATRVLGDALIDYCPVYVVPSDWAADPADLDDETFDRLLSERIPYALWRAPEELREWKGAA